MMRPGTLPCVIWSSSARAAASATGLCALCWSPWKSPCVPRSASYSAMRPSVGPVAPAGEVRRREGGRHSRHAGVDREAIPAEQRRERVHRLEFVPADFGMMADPVGHTLQLAGPERGYAGEDAIARGA